MVKMANPSLINEPDDQESNPDPIVQILYTEGQYWIYHKAFYDKRDDFISQPEKVIWYSVRDFRNSASSLGYKLKKGDILKFGRARLRVKEISTGDNAYDTDTRIKGEDSDSGLYIPENFFVAEEDLSDDPSCRICFNSQDELNPLISP
mmetsp:Transcript_8673/g.8194  ORF Transcript_8673/g.8194 Transcript_8673/m.8194 type:complete len:149 (-) Transcript_8673:691-1137(-)